MSNYKKVCVTRKSTYFAKKLWKNIIGIVFMGKVWIRGVYSYFYPYLFYCMSVLASTYPSNLRRLITLPKQVVRIMSRSAFHSYTDPLFKSLKILNLESIYKLQIAKFTYQYRSGLLPDSFNNMFLVTLEVRSFFIYHNAGLI